MSCAADPIGRLFILCVIRWRTRVGRESATSGSQRVGEEAASPCGILLQKGHNVLRLPTMRGAKRASAKC